VFDFQEPFVFVVVAVVVAAVVAVVVVAAVVVAAAVDGCGIVGFSICVVLLVDAKHKIEFNIEHLLQTHDNQIENISFKCS